MSCSTGTGCSTTKSCSAGCNNNGACATGGCNKLNTFDWFGNMLPPGETEAEVVYEVRFKNTRKGFYKNVNGLNIMTGDQVVVESDRGYDVGTISLGGVLARLQMKKKGIKENSAEIRKIYRRATADDLSRMKEAKEREYQTLLDTRQIIEDLKLDMKLSDVEFQGDNTKAIFYYIADQRVDFRQLIKVLAERFRIRVEMKQIGLRHEAGLVGGIGSCGRELCCSTWLTDFKTVSTSAARYQNLSLNPMKISGQCGRLKCCLNYELETYLDALQDIPEQEIIETEIGRARLQKTDIFKKIMWFSYENESNWIPLTVEMVNSMIEMNQKGEKPSTLHALEGQFTPVQENGKKEVLDFVDVVGQADLREDPRKKRKKKKKRNPRGQGKPGEQQQPRQKAKDNGGSDNRNKQSPEGKSRNQPPRGKKRPSNKRGNRNQGQNRNKPDDKQ